MEAILRVVAGGDGRRMRIMYGAYLSYEQLEEYAAFMVKKDLVYKEEGTELYKLTRKGEAFLLAGEQVGDSPNLKREDSKAIALSNT
jgi:predicted transcriptional regulator